MVDKKHTVIGIIPAKGYSRRVARKNMRVLNGHPLIFYTIQNVLKSDLLDVKNVFVSTDSEEISAYCADFGILTRCPRLPEHSGDNVHSSVPLLDLLKKLGGAGAYSHCVQLLPTYPLRTTSTLDRVIELSLSRNTNVLTVTPVGKGLLHLRTVSPDGCLNTITEQTTYNFQSQDVPELHYINGVVYCAPTKELQKNRTFQYGTPTAYLLDKFESLDIDTEADLKMAGRLMAADATHGR